MKKLVAALAAALVLAGCSAPAGTSSPSVASGKTVTVFAAASLKGAFTKIGDAFGAETGAKVSYNFNGSSALVDQLKGGAPADVFASADESNMKKATDAALTAGKPTLFATNVLTLVVAPGNPATITGLDASLDGKKLVVCAVGVPCGNALATLEKNLGVSPKPVSREQTVTDVLGKVTSGEAGVWRRNQSWALSHGRGYSWLEGGEQLPIRRRRPPVRLAKAYIDYVTGPKGQAILTEFGFGKP